MVYCDGNAMGRLVQQLDSPETTTAFSDIVDGSICEACHEALDWVCASEIAQVRKAQEKGEKLPFLPADILLLGGDDLLVLLPADRALIFAERVADIFATRTREKIDKLPAGATRHFFMNSLQQKGMTISCGVALAPAKYPFYLLRELAEALLKNAKKKGSKDPTCQPYWAPAYIDFHLVAGSSSQDLGPIRMDDYYCSTDHKRTLRPYRLDQLGRLRDAVTRLHQAGLPRSKVQDFFDAALDRLPRRTERRAREVFGRCSRAERQALWLAVQDLAGSQSVSPDWFPWLPVPVKPNQKEKRQTPLADLMEAYDLFPEEMP
jgi:GGDEF domain-containing protein